MLRSMFAGVSGLRNHQVKMDVIGNNIANVNTYGFKSSRVTFQEMYAQTTQAASGPSGALGGVNPKQIGLGVATSSVDVIHEGSAIQTTDRALDLSINGEGFLKVMQDENVYYTRAGNLYLDPNGYLVTADGMFVQGIMFIDAGSVEGLPQDVADVLGSDENIKSGATTYEEYIASQDFTAENSEANTESLIGRMFIPQTYSSISIGQDGVITALDEKGQITHVGAVPLTLFVNPGGLDRVGNSLYQESSNSGMPVLSKPTEGAAGSVKSGSLEMSNVDLSKEFTDMIITQRGYQANSRVITVSDTLLEELVNLKR